MTVGSTVVNPGEQTSFIFPYAMTAGMGGPHHFQVHIRTNDPDRPVLTFEFKADTVEK